jgi:ribosomal-protein-alanine N-acetyltransferase
MVKHGMMQNNMLKINEMSADNFFQVYEVSKAYFGDAWSEKSFEDEIKNPLAKTFVAICNDKVIGFLNVRAVLDEIMINNIAVTKDYVKCGIGSKLMNELYLYADKIKAKSITLEVRKSNKNALNFYEKHLFYVVGQRNNFYSNPCEDAVLMTKDLEV